MSEIALAIKEFCSYSVVNMSNQSPERSLITPIMALRAVRATFGSDAAMADAFRTSQPTVWRWLNQYGQIPAEHTLRAEALTGVPRHQLRPDLYPRDLGPSPEWPGHQAFLGVDSAVSRVSFNPNSALQGEAA